MPNAPRGASRWQREDRGDLSKKHQHGLMASTAELADFPSGSCPA